jgi:putative CRISPR-associated protein (TIGR02619 family)
MPCARVSLSKLIVTTCGTSLLTDQAGETAALLRETGHMRPGEVVGDQLTTLQRHIAARAARLDAADLAAAATLCAELRGLSMHGSLGSAERTHHVLIASDTWQGDAASSMLEAWLARRTTVERHVIPGLLPADMTEFGAALSELARLCLELVEGYRAAGYRITFNLNGGFKSVQGFMQSLGCLCADECIYVFETGTELMRIPRLPLTLDPAAAIGRHLPLVRAMANGRAQPVAEVAGIPETLLLVVDGAALLSAWGEIMWQACRDQYYAEALLPALSPRVIWGPRFEKEVRALAADRRAQMNRQLDRLSALMDYGRPNPDSLGFKPIRGQGPLGATHEFRAWSDQDAARGFGHFGAAGAFLIDTLGAHL